MSQYVEVSLMAIPAELRKRKVRVLYEMHLIPTKQMDE
jgi:hypothetical protein